jgi:hypothetical protein
MSAEDKAKNKIDEIGGMDIAVIGKSTRSTARGDGPQLGRLSPHRPSGPRPYRLGFFAGWGSVRLLDDSYVRYPEMYL